MTGTEAETVVQHLLASSAIEKISDYAARGRACRSLSPDELRVKFVAAYRARLNDVWSRAALRLTDDLESEFQLRGLDPPFEMVEREALALQARMSADIRARMSEMTEEDLRDASASMLRDYATVRRSES